MTTSPLSPASGIDGALAAYTAAEASHGADGIRLARLAAVRFAAAGADPADVANAHLLAAEHAAGDGQLVVAVEESGLALAQLDGQPGGVRQAQQLIWIDAHRAHGAARRDDGQHDAARHHLRLAIAAARDRPDAPPRLLVTCLNDLGMLGKFSGRYEEALAAYREAETLAAGLADPEPWLAVLDHNIGGLHHSMGEHEQARARTERSLRAAERRPTDRAALARELGALGAIEIDCGEPADAVAHLDAAIAAFADAGAERHLDAAAAWSNLGRAHAALGATGPAAEAYERAIALRRAACRPGHPDLLLSLNNYAALLIDDGERDRARSLLDEAIDQADAGLGDDHPLHRVLADNRARTA